MKLINIMRQQLTQMKAEAKELANREGVTAQEINVKMDEIKALKARIAMQQQFDLDEEEEIENRINDGQGEFLKDNYSDNLDEKEFNALHVKAFAKAIAKKSLNDNEMKALSSNTDADGGYLIPKDVLTQINLLSREYVSLRNLVTVAKVNTKEGSRILEIDAATTGFTDIEELTDLPNLSSPQWTKVDYKIRDLGGLLPIPNSLLADETGGLVQYLAEWFVKKAYATDNSMLLFADGTKGTQGIIGTAKTADTIGIDNVFVKEVLASVITFPELKSILNKGFPRPIAKTAKIVTNQSGLDILDNMADTTGRPYLTGDGTEEFPYKFKGRTVIVYDDDTIPNDTTDALNPLAPLIIGDLKKGVVLFDRQQMSVASSKEAGFANNSTVMRGIVRQDNRIWDKKAVKVYYSPLS
ncbi:MAG: phage major capsid protein [Clostridia bacterium]|nr:phage major capsid protein [Clostridia bacterium]